MINGGFLDDEAKAWWVGAKSVRASQKLGLCNQYEQWLIWVGLKQNFFAVRSAG